MSSSVIFPFQIGSCSLWSSWAGSSSWPSSWLCGGLVHWSCILQQSSSLYIKKNLNLGRPTGCRAPSLSLYSSLFPAGRKTMQLLILKLSVTQSALTNNTAILVNVKEWASILLWWKDLQHPAQWGRKVDFRGLSDCWCKISTHLVNFMLIKAQISRVSSVIFMGGKVLFFIEFLCLHIRPALLQTHET